MKQKSHNINTLDDLRDKVLEALEALNNGEIDLQQAGVIAKLSETVISGVKTQMDYARLTDQTPHIPFIDNCAKTIEGEQQYYIEN